MKSVRLLVIAAFVLSFAGAIWMFVDLRRELKTVRPAEAMGPLRPGADADLAPKIENYLNQKARAEHSSYTCVQDFFGRDNLFAYVDRACGEFERDSAGQARLKDGIHEMARIELDGTGAPIGLAEPEKGEDHATAMIKLFPPEIRRVAEQAGEPRVQALFERGITKQEADHPR